MNAIFSYIKRYFIKQFRISKVSNIKNYIDSFTNCRIEGDLVHISQKVPHIIWSYWESDNYSPTVEACIAQLRELHPAFDIHILDNTNLKEYLPDFPDFSSKLPIANKADLIRLMLLSKYGGIWTDASILFSRSIDSIFTLDNIDVDMIAFHDHTSKNISIPIVEDWFIAAIPNSRFINLWLQEFKACILSSDPFSYYSARSDYSILTQTYSHLKNYWLVYTSAQVVISDNKKSDYNIKLFDSAYSAHFYSHYCGWSSMHIAKFLLLNKYKDVGVNMVKLTGEMRKCTDNLIERGIFRKDSYFGRFLK